MPQDNRVYLLEILESARAIQQFVQNMTQEDFKQSKLHQYAVAKALEVIGEAAGNLSEEFVKQYPEIPWPAIVGMRNRLVHNYANTNLEIVWRTIHENITPLIDLIAPIVPPTPPGVES